MVGGCTDGEMDGQNQLKGKMCFIAAPSTLGLEDK